MNVVKASKLSKMDLLGTSDPYVKLSLSGERLPSKKTTIKMNNLNPIWNEKFKLVVKDPESQVLQLQVYDWDKVLPFLFNAIEFQKDELNVSIGFVRNVLSFYSEKLFSIAGWRT